ncbi:MAG: hypothetical protein OXH24_01660 [Cyanobacteria bacterium MAG IRC3_bin_20]|nr:hypothetical protein [Cyanobacteria bacterium MAG IRC3_bin_20]
MSRTKFFIDYADANSIGARMPRISWKGMVRCTMVLPPEPVAAAFTGLIQFMKDHLISGIYGSQTLTALNDTVPSRLDPGELRLAEATEIVEVMA